MRKVLWELPRNQQIAVVAGILLIAFGALAIYAASGFQAMDCASVKARAYEQWNNSLPLLTLQFRANVTEADAAAFVRDNGLQLRQSNVTASFQYFMVNAPADKAERIRLACAWEQSPLIEQVYLMRPLFYADDAL